MKILQVNSVCGVGSTGRIATDLYKVINENDGECKILYGRGEAPDNIESINVETKIGNYLHVLKTRLLDKHGEGSIQATRKLINEIEKYKPDIIHIHNIHGYYLNIEILFKYLNDIETPLIWTLHDCWPFTGHCAYFDFVDCQKWKTECKNCVQKKSYPSSLFIDNSYNNFKLKQKLFTEAKNMTIVTPSIWLKDLVKQSFLKKYNVEVINNGIDLSIFKPTNSNIKKELGIEDKFIILGVASVWDQRKGLNYFNLLQEHLSDEFKIVLIGVNDTQKKQISDNIICINKTNNAKELAQYYTIADIFVNPTLEDNFPTTNLEALACGTPVITFSTGGSIESIDEKTGIIIEKGNMEELAKSILMLKDKSIIIDRNDCINRARMYYDKNVNFNKYIELYHKVLK